MSAPHRARESRQGLCGGRGVKGGRAWGVGRWGVECARGKGQENMHGRTEQRGVHAWFKILLGKHFIFVTTCSPFVFIIPFDR